MNLEAQLAHTSIRLHPRVPVDISVRVFPPHGQAVLGRAEDIGCGGIAVYVPADCAVGDAVQLSFELPHSHVRFGVKGEIRNRNGFRYGISFDGLTPDEYAEIERVVRIIGITHHGR